MSSSPNQTTLDTTLKSDTVRPKLYPLQRVGAAFLVEAGSALCADPPGSGKCAMTIRALEKVAERYGHENAFPALIICPSSMRWTWEREIKLWAPNRSASVVYGTAVARRKSIAAISEDNVEYLIVNWESLAKHSRIAGYGYVRLTEEEKTEKELNAVNFATIVADEAHRIKNPTAKQTRAAWYLGDHARHRYALTGTPIANVPEDLWSIMRFVSPIEHPSKTRYVNRFVEQAWSPFGFSQSVGLNAATREEFFKIIDPRMLRRPKELLVPGLPAKLPPQIREVELGTKQRTAYNGMRKELLAQMDSGTLVAHNPLMQVLRLVQLASAYGSIETVTEELEDGTKQEKQLVTLEDPSCKVDALMDLLDEMNGESLVVFAESVQLLRIAAARLDGAAIGWSAVTGDVVGEARQQSIDAFQAGEKQVILCTYGAGSEGLTLTKASTVARLQRSWSSIKNAQAEDRVHRPGQLNEVRIIDFMSRDTVESRILAAVQNKEARLEELVRDADTLRNWLAK